MNKRLKRGFTIVCCLIAVCGSGYVTAAKSEKQDQLEKLTELQSKRQFDEVISLSKQILAVDAANMNDSAKAFVYHHMLDAYLYKRNFKQAKVCIDLLDVKIESIKSTRLKIRWNNLNAEYFLHIGKLSHAEEHLIETKRLLSTFADTKQEICCHNTWGLLHKRKGDHQKALQSFLLALEKSEQTSNIREQSYILNNIGDLYRSNEEYENALKFFEQGLTICRTNKLTDVSAIIHNNIGLVFSEKGESLKALDYLKESIRLRLMKAAGDSLCILNSLYGIGNEYFNLNDFLQASHYYDTLIRLSKRANNLPGIFYGTIGFARIEEANGNYLSAIELINSLDSLHIIRETPVYETLYASFLSHNYEQIGDYKKSLEYYKLADSLHSEQFNIDREREISKLRESFEIKLKERENSTLKAKTQQYARVNRNNKYWLIGASIFILISIISLVIIIRFYLSKIRNNDELRKQKAEVDARNKQLNNFNKELRLQRDLIEKQKQELEQLNSVKDTLLSIISHDLRSPLAHIETSLNFFSNEVFSKDELIDLIPMMEKQVMQVTFLIDNLLMWSRSQLDGITTRKEPFLVSRLFNEARQEAHSRLEAKQIQLQIHIDQDCEVLADFQMISLVVRNLLSNAIKYTPPKTTVELTGIHLGNRMRIFVKDQGIGIESSRIRQIFEPGHKSTIGTNSEPGHGLGLTICKDFLLKNSSEINVESQIGKGSTFSFELPLITSP